MTYKVFIDSALWECSSNLVSCSMIYRYLIENGHEVTNDASKANFIIINSCGSVKNMVDYSMNLYQNHYSLKKKNAIIIMFGCLVEIDKELFDSFDLYPISFDESSKLDEFFLFEKKI